MKKILAALSLISVVGLSGCVISVDGHDNGYEAGDWQKREAKNRQQIATLQPGLNFDQVSAEFGAPDFSEFHQNDSGRYQVLFYRTHRKEGDGVTTKDECTALVFRNAELVGWGDNAYRDIQ